MSPPAGQGSHWEAIAIAELASWTGVNGAVSFSSSDGFTLPDGPMRSPDAAWVSEGRWSALSMANRRVYPPLCPEFVIEILFATDSRKWFEAKMEMWVANGAQLAWMIDPYATTARIYRPAHVVQLLERRDSIEAENVVPGFRLTMRLFREE